MLYYAFSIYLGKDGLVFAGVGYWLLVLHLQIAVLWQVLFFVNGWYDWDWGKFIFVFGPRFL